MDTVQVAALYKFVRLEDFAELRAPLLAFLEAHGVKGTLLLAPEGINGTLAGTADGLARVLAHLRADERFRDLEAKLSFTAELPFPRMKVRLKKEIVTMGVPGIDPNQLVGTYVAPENWNRLLEDPDVLVIDTRNEYETLLGSFQGAKIPHLDSFRQFPGWLRDELDGAAHEKVAMFCTGGIRCEKSTAFLKQEGVEEVFHLKGGILKYLETIPEEDSLWWGECFVFDERVSVGHGLRAGTFVLCRACRYAIGPEELQAPEYEYGVSCPHCCAHTTPEQKAGFAERAKQVALAEARGSLHLKTTNPTPH